MQTDSEEFPKALIWVVTLSILSGVAFFAHDARGNELGSSERVPAPMALVYDGPGACPEDCAASAANAARAAGFNVRIVGPQALTDRSTPDQVTQFFQNVRVWIQPGGKSRTAAETMTAKLKSSLVDFVRGGGGYVGFCAGAFLSTPIIGSTGVQGLGLFPGKTWPYTPPPARVGLAFSIEKLNWQGQERYVYFEGGPYLLDLDPSVEVTATYKDGNVAAARAAVGAGRIYISGPHPEAPLWWSTVDRVTDADGIDQDLAINMIRWVARVGSPTRW
ncbi:MAG: hypothetical protein JST80_13675 [Bdellovibrionales bacterium]|nr:hypothetical protein [Bdellovibrionales bacterium]